MSRPILHLPRKTSEKKDVTPNQARLLEIVEKATTTKPTAAEKIEHMRVLYGGKGRKNA